MIAIKGREKVDARYTNSERLINSALEDALSNRKINVRMKDICAAAMITAPTFYAHCRDSSDALEKYETKLRNDFQERLPQTNGREIIFTVLLGFIRDEKDYFSATVPNSNYWLLQSIFDDLQDKLAQKNVDEKIYACYTSQQMGLIGCWVKYDKYAKTKIPLYVDKMQAVKLMDIGL